MSQYCFRRGKEHIIRDDADNVLFKVKKSSFTQSNVRLVDATGDGVDTPAAMTDNATLVLGTSARFQQLDPNGAHRNVTLPAVTNNAGLDYVIVNKASGAYNLVVKNAAGSTIITINQAEIGWVFCDGTSWYGAVMSENALSTPTLQQAFGSGNEINTADGTPKLEVGDGTDSLLFYTNSSVPTIATDGTSNLVIAPDGGGTTVTGTLTTSGDLTIGSTKLVVTAATGALTMATGSSITLDTNKFTVDSDGNTACAGTLAAGGNITGTFAGTLAATAWAANPIITLSATTANGVTVNGQTVTSGSLLYMACDSSLTGASGNFLTCYNDTTAATPFTIASDGAVTIGGTAASAALTISQGDVEVSAGGVDILGGAVATDLLDITRSNSATNGHALDINMGTAAIAGNAVDIEFGAGASTGDAISIAMGSTNVAGGAIVITAGGSRTDALIDITDTSTSNSPTIDINNTGVRTGGGLDISYSSGAATEDAVTLTMGTNVAGRAIYVSSAATGTSDEGAVLDVAHTGALGAGADVVRLYSSGNISSTSNILSIVQDTGAGTAGAYGLHIDCSGTNVEGLYVAAGKSKFAETVELSGTEMDITGSAGANDILDITKSNTATDGHGIDISMGTAAVAGNAINIAFGAGISTGDAIAVAMGSTNVAGGVLTATVSGARTDATIDITDDSTSNSPTISIANTGIRTGGALAVSYGSAAATEDAVSLTMGTNVAGRAIYVSSAATGASNEGAALDVAHTGALAANADVVRIYSSGNISSTSNLLSLFQETGAGTAGAYCLHVQADGTNVEAINVASGKCTFAETCTFSDIEGVDAALNVTGLAAAAGGTVVIAGGAASGGAGGLVSLTGGAGTAGVGGAATLKGGAGDGANAGGACDVTGGAGGAAGAGGGVTIVGGAPASGSANGGAISITSGAAGAAGGTAGAVGIDSGAASGGAANAITIGGTNATAVNLGNNSATVASTARVTTTDGVSGGTAKVVGGRAYSKTADSTSTSTTDTEALGQYAIPANTLKEGSVVKFKFGLIVDDNNAADTLTVDVKLGPTTVAGQTLMTTTAHDVDDNDIIYGEGVLICRAAPSAASECSFYGTLCEPAADGTAAPVVHRLAPTNFATNGILYLEVCSDWSAAHAENDATLELFEVEIL